MKRIFLFLLPVLAFVWAFSPATGIIVKGKITDEQGKGLGSVSITIYGTSKTASSATDGSYSVETNSERDLLVFSLIGFETQKEKVRGRKEINIVLKATKQELSEVVVSAYSRKEISDDIIITAPLPNMTVNDPGVLHGRAAGIAIDKRRGNPGSTGRVRADKENREFLTGDEKDEEFDTEGYDYISENPFLKVTDNPLSTFSIDVDAASYSNIRRYLNMGQLPPAGAVRIEEMINYFHYSYPAPSSAEPFSVNTEIADCPWNPSNKLVLVGLQGRKIPVDNLPASNLVFLVDVSGSMQEPQKLPLVQASMKLLVDQLRERDHVAMVVYAGAAGLVLPSTPGNNKIKIKEAIDKLEAGGSTAGGAGIQLAYKIARENFIREGNNRVILCTDGDFNIGASSDDAMERLIEEERKSGVFLTVLGYGMGNYKDSKMQKLADKGNGNHAYIDGISEARKVLVNEFGGTLFTIAKDVKLQIEFNPEKVQGYRLVGYENRMLNKEDFNNDKKDAGDMGSGHSVTALYEVIPAGAESPYLQTVDPLKYQHAPKERTMAKGKGEIMNIKIRYKQPDAGTSRLLEHPVFDERLDIARTSDNFRFAAAVAQFGMILRNSEYKSHASYKSVLKLAVDARGNDEEGYRSEFIRLVKSASLLTGKATEGEDDAVSARD